MSISDMTAAEMVACGQAFRAGAGKPPARDDYKMPIRAQWESQLGFLLPNPSQVLRVFASWSLYIDACGFERNDRFSVRGVERAAVDHARTVLGFTEEDYERSVTDGWLPSGQTCEIKGSVLRRHKALGYHYFAWRIHGRNLSISTDQLVLVGVGRELEVLVRLEIPRAALRTMVDGKSNVTLYSSAVWGAGQSQFRRFIKHHLRLPEKEIIGRFSLQEVPDDET